MVIQYPYILEKLVLTDGGYNDQTGMYDDPTEEWVEVSKCRDDAESSGGAIQTTDGETYHYAYTVYLPKGTEPIEKGTTVRIQNRLEGNVKRFYKGQLHSILWL